MKWSFVKKHWRELGTVAVVFLAIGLFAMSLMQWAWNVQHPPEPQFIIQNANNEVEKKVVVDSQFIKDKLTNVGELSTLDVQFTKTMSFMDEEGIKFINKTGYSMIYTIIAKVGIQFEDIKINITDTEVIVTLPDAEILERHADGKTLQFYDEKWALFKSNTMNDVSEAVAMAEDDFDAQTDTINGYLKLGQERAELVVRTLLEGVIEDKRLVVQ